MNQTKTVDPDPGSALSFEELSAQLQDSLVRESESGPQPDPQQAEVPVSPAEPDAAQTKSGTEASEGESSQTFTVKDLAGRLGIDPAAVYAGLQIDLGNGSTVAFGEFKDRMKDVARSDELLAEVQQNRSKVETDLLQKNQAISLAMQEAGVQVSERHVQMAQQQRAAYADLQDRTLTELQPEYAESAYRQEFDSKVATRLKALGYSEHEAAFMKDARLRLEFYQHQRLLDEIAGIAHKKVKTQRNQTPGGSTRVSNSIAAIKSGQSDQASKVAQLGKLL